MGMSASCDPLHFWMECVVQKKVTSFESRKGIVEGLCPESRRPTPFESAGAVKYLRLPTAPDPSPHTERHVRRN